MHSCERFCQPPAPVLQCVIVVRWLPQPPLPPLLSSVMGAQRIHMEVHDGVGGGEIVSHGLSSTFSWGRQLVKAPGFTWHTIFTYSCSEHCIATQNFVNKQCMLHCAHTSPSMLALLISSFIIRRDPWALSSFVRTTPFSFVFKPSSKPFFASS